MGRVLHRQFRTVNVTVAAGTAQAAPATTAWSLGNVVVETLEVMIPRGHAGLTGVHVDYQGVTLLPWGEPPSFLVANDETITVPLDLEIGAPLSVVAYNLDSFSHTFYWRALVDVLLGQDTARDQTPVLLDLSAARG